MGGNRNANNNKNNFTIHTRPDGRRDFYQHDDRGYSNNSSGGSNKNYSGSGGSGGRPKYSGRGSQHYTSSGSYGRGFRRGQGTYRGGGSGSRKYLQDEDVAMSGEGKGGSRHQQLYNQSRGFGRRPRRGRMVLVNANSGWHKIVVKDVVEYSKVDVVNTLKELTGETFDPVLMEMESRNLVFYLEKSADIAKAIVNLSGRMNIGGDARKIYISCSDTTPPNRKFTPAQVEVIKAVMSDRYSAEMNRLDLSHFHSNKRLIKEQIFCPLYRRSCLNTVLEILTTNCPLVEELDLSRNQISSINNMTPLKQCLNLKRLYLERNRLKFIEYLDVLKGLSITELSLEGNPLCDKFKDEESYTSAVRNIFPKVERLDGMDLPKPILFEVEDNVTLPPTQPSSFFCSEQVKTVVLQFIQQYYQVFESGDRSLLAAAYTEDALFSLSAHFPDNAMGGSKYTRWMELENRNLKKATTTANQGDKRRKVLYKGRSDIADLLLRFPTLAHDPNSFVVDVPLATPALMHVVLTGVFKQPHSAEGKGPQQQQQNGPIRNFMKSMIVVPIGAGFCVSNEELFVNPATVEQIRKAFKEGEGSAPPPATSSPPDTLSASHLEMINQFAVNSKMLPQYCKMCLEENNWDFAKAGEMFLTLQKDNKIPPEYFGEEAAVAATPVS